MAKPWQWDVMNTLTLGPTGRSREVELALDGRFRCTRTKDLVKPRRGSEEAIEEVLRRVARKIVVAQRKREIYKPVTSGVITNVGQLKQKLKRHKGPIKQWFGNKLRKIEA